VEIYVYVPYTLSCGGTETWVTSLYLLSSNRASWLNQYCLWRKYQRRQVCEYRWGSALPDWFFLVLLVPPSKYERFFFYWRASYQMLRTLRSLEGLLCNPMRKMMKMMRFFLLFHFNGAPVEWNWQGKPEVLGEIPIPVPLCPPKIPHGPTRDRTRASAVRGQRLTAWAMALPNTTASFCSTSNSCLLF
jgi:hypothetical protein